MINLKLYLNIKYLLAMPGRLLILILFPVITTCCLRNTIPGTGISIEINPADSAKSGFSDYFELEKCINLANNDSSVMQDIRKISIVDDKIFILTWGDPKILIFNINGDHIRTINRYGRGPGEYTYVVDMSISSDGKTICLFDKELRKLLYYNLSGDFLKSVDLNTDLETFTILNDGNILGYSFLNHATPLNDTIYQLWHFNSHGKILKGLLPVKREYLGNSIGLASSFNSTLSGLFFIPYTENTIYKITENPLQMTPLYKISFKDKTIPANLLEMPRKEMQKAFQNSYILSGEFTGTKVVLINIYSSAERKNLTAIFNRKTNSSVILNSKEIWDKTNELPISANQQNHYAVADRLVAIVQPFKLLEHDFKNTKSIGYQLKQKVKETDNPILVIYKERD
jgi:hypothetical protein